MDRATLWVGTKGLCVSTSNSIDVTRMHQCDQCGGEVTDQYWRVFSVEGVLHGCLNCEKKTGNHVPSDARSRSRSAEA